MHTHTHSCSISLYSTRPLTRVREFKCWSRLQQLALTFDTKTRTASSSKCSLWCECVSKNLHLVFVYCVYVQIYSLILFIPSIFLTSHFKDWQYVTLKDLFRLTEINGIDFLGNWNLQQHLTVIHLIILMAEKETVPKLDPCEWRSN